MHEALFVTLTGIAVGISSAFLSYHFVDAPQRDLLRRDGITDNSPGVRGHIFWGLFAGTLAAFIALGSSIYLQVAITAMAFVSSKEVLGFRLLARQYMFGDLAENKRLYIFLDQEVGRIDEPRITADGKRRPG